MSQEKSKVEYIKEASRHLRGDLAEQLVNGKSHFDEAGYQLLKFHGIYQQDDRDQRAARRARGEERAYSFMVRTRVPGGVLTADQYLTLDRLASEYGNETLRITTRQTVQFHGILKGDLKPALHRLNEALITTLAACGDVNRNVVGCPAPEHDRRHHRVTEICREIAARLEPKTRAYHEIWLDGRRVDDFSEEEEPLYGENYLPRKFKIAVAYADDNCVDVYTNDIGLIPVIEGDELLGFNVVVGGGMGMQHRNPDTFPRLADPLGFVPPERVVDLCESIVRVQKAHGNRSDRKQARMKYLVERWGIERFRAEVEKVFGELIAPFVPMGPLRVDDHLGWRPQGDGKYYLGLFVENGRIADRGEKRLRTALRTIVETHRPGVRFTPQQNILLTDLDEESYGPIAALLREHGVAEVEAISPARRYSMACPALPTCGLAIAESERVFPAVIDRIEEELTRLGLENEPISIRMTGCPNGCARPYTAEVAFVGRSGDRYNVYVGGDFAGDHLVECYAELVPLADLAAVLRPLFALWAAERRPGEGFGAFCRRKGVAALRAYAEQAGVQPGSA